MQFLAWLFQRCLLRNLFYWGGIILKGLLNNIFATLCRVGWFMETRINLKLPLSPREGCEKLLFCKAITCLGVLLDIFELFRVGSCGIFCVNLKFFNIFF